MIQSNEERPLINEGSSRGGDMVEAVSSGGEPGMISIGQVLDTIPEAVSIHSRDGVILLANKKAEAVYGKAPGEMIGRTSDEVFQEPVSSYPHAEAVFNGAGIEDQARTGKRVYRVSVDPILDRDGSVQGYVRIMRDTTEAQEAQEGLLRAERFATLGQMINGIAHDVGTPLNIISGYCEYLMMRTKEGEPGYKELTTILQQTRRVAEFIKQMLDLSRPSQGRSDAIGLKGFLAEVIDLAGHHLRKSGVKATLSCEVKPPLVYGDAPRLRQAFFNLLLNAMQQASAGGELKMEIGEPVSKPGFVSVVTSGKVESGAGIDFSNSLSGLVGDGHGASGLGLSLAREVFNGMGAIIDTVDLGERGNAVAIYLPVNR